MQTKTNRRPSHKRPHPTPHTHYIAPTAHDIANEQCAPCDQSMYQVPPERAPPIVHTRQNKKKVKLNKLTLRLQRGAYDPPLAGVQDAHGLLESVRMRAPPNGEQPSPARVPLGQPLQPPHFLALRQPSVEVFLQGRRVFRFALHFAGLPVPLSLFQPSGEGRQAGRQVGRRKRSRWLG